MREDMAELYELCKRYAAQYGEGFVCEVFEYCLQKLERIGKDIDYLPVLMKSELPQQVQMRRITAKRYPSVYEPEVIEREAV